MNTLSQKANNETLLWLAVLVAISVCLPACSLYKSRDSSHEILNAALWSQASAEYVANSLQAYQLAGVNLERALGDPSWTAEIEQHGDYSSLPPAVVLDLDQTVLDVSSYNARIILRHDSHNSENFAQWCAESPAPLISGVKEFINRAILNDVEVFYLSARKEMLRGCTRRNLLYYGLPVTDQARLLLSDGTESTSKEQHRANIASKYRILLLIGDDLNDFVHGAKSGPEMRSDLVNQHSKRWGREWIILPNPMYGSWESAIYGYDRKLTRDQRLYLKLQQLKE